MLQTYKMITGYTSGTFDLPHHGHFNILRRMKALCDVLIVGLTTDKLGACQKRKPIMSYDHRESILINCEHVDIVLAHEGLPKTTVIDRLKIDVVFIGEDYIGCDEYKDLDNVVFLPRTKDISTTKLMSSMIVPSCTGDAVYFLRILWAHTQGGRYSHEVHSHW
jgi:glycerol-3-phosphate cytidylyltransferase